MSVICFFFNDTATTEIYTYGHTLSLHDALPILGVQVKRTGPRYVNDLNRPFTLGGTIIGGVAVSGGAQVMDAKAPAYTLVDLDARLSLAPLGKIGRASCRARVCQYV